MRYAVFICYVKCVLPQIFIYIFFFKQTGSFESLFRMVLWCLQFACLFVKHLGLKPCTFKVRLLTLSVKLPVVTHHVGTVNGDLWFPVGILLIIENPESERKTPFQTVNQCPLLDVLTLMTQQKIGIRVQALSDGSGSLDGFLEGYFGVSKLSSV